MTDEHTIDHICDECAYGGEHHRHIALSDLKGQEGQAKKPPTKYGWKTGDTGYIDGKHVGGKPGVTYQAKILDWAFSAEHDYLQLKLEITHEAEVFGKKVKQTWVHPKPVQSYKLRRNSFDHEKGPKGKK